MLINLLLLTLFVRIELFSKFSFTFCSWRFILKRSPKLVLLLLSSWMNASRIMLAVLELTVWPMVYLMNCTYIWFLSRSLLFYILLESSTMSGFSSAALVVNIISDKTQIRNATEFIIFSWFFPSE